MSSNLKVNTILPSTGNNIGIGTNGGELVVDGGFKVQVGTALTLGHSIGLQYATQNLHSTGFEINQINASGIITASHFYGNGANLTALNIVTDTSPQLGGTLDTNNQDITFNGAQNVSWDSSAADFIFNDYAKINLGTDKDFKMYQAGNNTILQSDNTSGGVYLQGSLVQVGSETGEAGVKFVKDGAAELYFNNSKKYETTSDGAKVTGELDVFKSGVGDIFHVQGNGTGAVVAKIENAYNSDNDRFAILELKSGKGSIRFNSNGDSNEGAITYNMADNTMVFGVNNASEKLRIQSGGGISFNGDTATANALDDYEEGSWSPLWSNSASNSGGTTTSNNMYGRYTKIGKMVHAYFYTWGLPAGNSGNMYLQGLPFSCASNPGAFFCAVQSAFYNFGADNYYNLGLRLSTNRTYAELIFCRKDPGNYVPATFAGFINYYTNFNGVLTYEVE